MPDFILETIRVKDEDEMWVIKSKTDKKNHESALKSEGDDEFDIESALKKYQDRGRVPLPSLSLCLQRLNSVVMM